MKKSFKLVLILLLATARVFALNWPVIEKKILLTFASLKNGSFNSGLDFAGNRQEVYPVEDGEVIFTYREQEDYSSFPRGLGSFIVLQHAGNFQSVYSNLEKGSLPDLTRVKTFFRSLSSAVYDEILRKRPSDTKLLTKALVKTAENYTVDANLRLDEKHRFWRIMAELGRVTRLGMTSDYQSALDNSFSLLLFDAQERLILNPLHYDESSSLLRPVLRAQKTEREKPVIEYFGYIKNNQVMVINSASQLALEKIQFVLKCYSVLTAGKQEIRSAPALITLALYGKEYFRLDFTVLEEKEGRLIQRQTGKDSAGIYLLPYLFALGAYEVLDNNIDFAIEVTDYKNNRSSLLIKTTNLQ